MFVSEMEMKFGGWSTAMCLQLNVMLNSRIYRRKKIQNYISFFDFSENPERTVYVLSTL